MEAQQGVLGRDVGRVGRQRGVIDGDGQQFVAQALEVGEGTAPSSVRSVATSASARRASQKASASSDATRHWMVWTMPSPAWPRAAPGNSKKVRIEPGRAALVAEVEVVDVRLVEVDRLLHQTQAQHTRVEVHVARCIGGDRGDVMQTLECHSAHSPSCKVVVCATIYMMVAQTTTLRRPPDALLRSLHAQRFLVPMATPTTKLPAARQLDERELRAWRGMLRAHAALTKALDADLDAAHGLPLSSYEVLMYLNDADDRRMRMRDLAASVILSRSRPHPPGRSPGARGPHPPRVVLERCARRLRRPHPRRREMLAAARTTHLAGVRRSSCSTSPTRSSRSSASLGSRRSGLASSPARLRLSRGRRI